MCLYRCINEKENAVRITDLKATRFIACLFSKVLDSVHLQTYISFMVCFSCK